MSELLLHNPEFDLPIEMDGDSFRVYGPRLAEYLGYHAASEMVRHLPDDEKTLVKGAVLERTANDQAVWWVTEAGFYHIVGQRQTGRIKDLAVRAAVARFQTWVFTEVLPSIRRRGSYTADQFSTWSSDEMCAQIRQQVGLDFYPASLGRALRDAGIIKQNGAPHRKYQHFFHHTGTAWHFHPAHFRQVVQMVADSRQRILNAQFQLPIFVAEVES